MQTGAMIVEDKRGRRNATNRFENRSTKRGIGAARFDGNSLVNVVDVQYWCRSSISTTLSDMSVSRSSE